MGCVGLTVGVPACYKARPPAGSCKIEKGESAGQIRGFDPGVSQTQPAGHDGLTRE